MSIITREQVLELVAGLGPVRNVFLISEVEDAFGLPMIWNPEIGLRYLIIENDEMAQAVYQYLREAGVRRFTSEAELGEAQQSEKWEGWDPCEDYRRVQEAVKQLAGRGSR